HVTRPRGARSPAPGPLRRHRHQGAEAVDPPERQPGAVKPAFEPTVWDVITQANEDYAGLYEIVWSFRSNFMPDAPESKVRAAAPPGGPGRSTPPGRCSSR